MVQGLNGKGKQDLQLVILTQFVLSTVEEQEKKYVGYNPSIKCSEPGLCIRKVPNMLLQVYFSWDLCEKCYLICWHPCVLQTEFFLHLNKKTIKQYFNVCV